MLEISKKRTRGVVATGLAVGALIGGATEAHAGAAYKSGPAIEASAQLDPRLTIEQATAEAVQKLKTRQDVNYYRGTVNIIKEGNVKFAIEDPIIIYRGDTDPNKKEFSATHPRSQYWAIGYIQRGVKDGNLGSANLVLLPYNNGGNNFVFNKAPDIPKGKPPIDVVAFDTDAKGNLDLGNPLDIVRQPVLGQDGHPEQIAIGFNK